MFISFISSLALLSSLAGAQVAAPAEVGGVALPKVKSCTLNVTGSSNHDDCQVKVAVKVTGRKCDGSGKSLVEIDMSITCGTETCREYGSQDNCGSDTGSFSYACHNGTFVVDTKTSWSTLMGPNGTCDDLSVSAS